MQYERLQQSATSIKTLISRLKPHSRRLCVHVYVQSYKIRLGLGVMKMAENNLTVHEISIDEFVNCENLDEFSFTFAHAIKTRRKYIQHVKDFSSFSGIHFAWRLFQCGNTYVLIFGSRENTHKHRYMFFGWKKGLPENYSEVRAISPLIRLHTYIL